MKGLARASLVVLLVLAGALWVGALVSAAKAEAPALLVYGEPVARRGSTWPLRALAVWPSGGRATPLEGSVVSDGQRVLMERGVARVPLPREGDEVHVLVEGAPEGATARVALAVQLARTWPRGSEPRYEPWTREIARGGAPASSGPPLYPLTGRLPAMLPAEILVLHDGGFELRAMEPNAAGAVMPDGRMLRAEPSVVVVQVPEAARPGAEIEVKLSYAGAPEVVHVDLLVNGIVRDLRVLTGDERMSTRLALPDDVGAGWYAVRASPSPLPAIPSAHALGLLLKEGDPADPVAVVRQAAKLPALQDGGDPLLRQLMVTPPENMKPVRALLGRLRVDDVRAPNLAPTAREQTALDEERRASAVARFRVPFRITGVVFALLAALVALASAKAAGRWREVAEDTGPETTRRALPSLGWALLAFATSLSGLWVLDWAIGLTLGRAAG